VKLWYRKDEWQGYANCLGDSRFISDPRSTEDTPWAPAQTLDRSEVQEIRRICGECRVRPECIKWALDYDMSSVWVAGEYLPDPAFKRGLRSVHDRLRGSIPGELAARGDDV
jgi:hypothetical protein